MTLDTTVDRPRAIWHPLVVATALTTVSAGVAGVAAIGAGLAGARVIWLTLGVWTCLGLAAGFATSGST